MGLFLNGDDTVLDGDWRAFDIALSELCHDVTSLGDGL